MVDEPLEPLVVPAPDDPLPVVDPLVAPELEPVPLVPLLLPLAPLEPLVPLLVPLGLAVAPDWLSEPELPRVRSLQPAPTNANASPVTVNMFFGYSFMVG